MRSADCSNSAQAGDTACRTAAPRATAPARAVDYLVSELAALGTTHVFGVGGANIEDLYDALHHSPAVTGILAKHEFSAGTMADGYARTSGRLGVVATTSGGAALNVVPALGEAYTSRVPVLALVGQPPSQLNGRGSFQDSSGQSGTLNAEDIFGSVSRYCARVSSPDELPARFGDAVSASLSSPGGPAVLLLPKDMQQDVSSRTHYMPPRARGADAPPEYDLSRAVSVLEEARNASGVIVVAGDGVARADVRGSLRQLADALGARVAVTPDAKDVFDNSDPRFVGVTGGMGHPTVAEHLGEASACLLVGTRLPVIARDGLDDLLAKIPVVCVAEEPPYIEALVVAGLLTETLPALTTRLSAGFTRSITRATGIRNLVVPPRSGNGLGYRETMTVIGDALPSDAAVFVDAGNCGAAAIHHLSAPRHGRFVLTLGMGGMGYTFGAAIGAHFANTDKSARTYVVAGDGAFYMHGSELHTAVEYRLPITFIVLNNNAHAMCVTREQVFYGSEYSYNRFGPANLAAGVDAMFPALEARSTASAQELAQALTDTRTSPGPVFISVDCDVDEIPPVTSFLARR
ncbi:thiamine pyrophosphate-binding protein [Saccharopolyspora phatthalungensis]|uniref:Acetolactate synthase-1/2/3 large subunit n=1 Tax=Saccharopolyspora phatthalungensis TaxID=664693 RepID=A0A840QH94_9PSEU|nr:thiamine pyrophosphate-binding protein [Saccharopolyspora phatthalungensis]MBB5159511.1 acetolactate synthase-1/2/3 large subunit [Saccharopolyspora phatthalungensis]